MRSRVENAPTHGRILKVARTIADPDAAEYVTAKHLEVSRLPESARPVLGRITRQSPARVFIGFDAIVLA